MSISDIALMAAIVALFRGLILLIAAALEKGKR